MQSSSPPRHQTHDIAADSISRLHYNGLHDKQTDQHECETLLALINLFITLFDANQHCLVLEVLNIN